MIRRCANPDCGREITLCFGAVKAGDWLRAQAGEIEWHDVRELCGLCVEKVQWNADEKLEPHRRAALESATLKGLDGALADLDVGPERAK